MLAQAREAKPPRDGYHTVQTKEARHKAKPSLTASLPAVLQIVVSHHSSVFAKVATQRTSAQPGLGAERPGKTNWTKQR